MKFSLKYLSLYRIQQTPEADPGANANATDPAGGGTPETNTNDPADTPSNGENGTGADQVPNTLSGTAGFSARLTEVKSYPKRNRHPPDWYHDHT